MPTRDFHHPYTPYSIQLDFMQTLYETIEEGKIGIFESPTGTGKSLSLICGSLTWLRNAERIELDRSCKTLSSNDEPDWVKLQVHEQRKHDIIKRHEELEELLQRARQRENDISNVALHDPHTHKRRRVELEDGESQYLVDDYSEDSTTANASSVYSREVQALMESREILKSNPYMVSDEVFNTRIKVFFASRTHSQLNQFVHELRRPTFPSSVLECDSGNEERVKHVALSSRKNLCINPDVSRLGSVIAINEKCLDLQTATKERCKFLPPAEDHSRFQQFTDATLASIKDIEDLVKLGKNSNTCPYYASRSAIGPAEIITLPYPLLLQKSAREALGIDIKGHVIIFDEAHNLIDAVTNLHSICVTPKQLSKAQEQIEIYLAKFGRRLKGTNKLYIQYIQKLICGLLNYLKYAEEGEVGSSDILSNHAYDQINVHSLGHYLKASKLPWKIEGYASRGQAIHRGALPILTHIYNFLLEIMNPSGEGRFFCVKGEENALEFRYMLLDPSFYFRDIIEDARSVIFAGGTMEPVDDYIKQLLPSVPSERLVRFSCRHIVPEDHLLVTIMGSGPRSVPFRLTFDQRTKSSLIEDMGHALLNLCSVIPDGVVAFFPSYFYLTQVVQQWQRPANGTCLYERICKRKRVFLEPREGGAVKCVLSDYAATINEKRGAILLAVVGGKMSEGINFSDKLGRAVIMVGLPFPNASSPDWKAKLEYFQKKSLLETGSQKEADDAGRHYYENACMRAVNQSIGRAIRHRADYAAIILLDQRFASPRISSKLPGWIRENGGTSTKSQAQAKAFPEVVKTVAAFFKSKAC